MSAVQARHLLVPTDFSDASQAGVTAAARLLRELGGQATLMHVLALPELHPAEGELEQSHPEDAELERAVHQHLDRVREQHFAGLEQVKTALVRSKSPVEAICRTAEELHASLIVISSHGHGGIERFLLGSVTERVVRHATCPVWVAR